MDRYAVRSLDLATEAPAFAALLARNIAGLEVIDAQRKCRVGLLGDPCGPARAFALEAKADPGLAGALAVQARRWHHDGREWTAACMADFSVDAAHRSLGPALKLVRHAVDACDASLLYGFPNPQATALLQRAGLAQIGLLQRWARPLSTRALARRPGAPPLRRALAAAHGVVDPLLGMADGLRRHRDGRGWQARTADFGEPWLDAVWQARDPALVQSARDGATVAWRYAGDLKGGWRLARIDDRKGEPMGHVVWRLADGVAEIGDVHGRGLPASIDALLLAFAAMARHEGALLLSLEFFGHGGVEAGIRRAGFVRHAAPVPMLGRVPADLPWPAAAFVTGFDRDTH